MTLHQCLYLHLLFPTLNNCLNPPHHHLIVDHFGINRADVNIQQPTTSEVANIEIAMAYNEDLYPPPPQDISNVFAAADLLSCSSSDSAKYKRAWHKSKVICSTISFAWEIPDT